MNQKRTIILAIVEGSAAENPTSTCSGVSPSFSHARIDHRLEDRKKKIKMKKKIDKI